MNMYMIKTLGYSYTYVYSNYYVRSTICKYVCGPINSTWFSLPSPQQKSTSHFYTSFFAMLSLLETFWTALYGGIGFSSHTLSRRLILKTTRTTISVHLVNALRICFANLETLKYLCPGTLFLWKLLKYWTILIFKQ